MLKLPDRPSSFQVWLILAIAVFAVSTAAIWVRLAVEATGRSSVGFSLFLAASRLILAAIALLPTWRSLARTSAPKSAIVCAGAAGLCLAIHFATWITSLSFTSIAASTALVTTNPIWVALLGWLRFRERPTPTTCVGIALALAGGLCIALGGGQTSSAPNPLLGDALALIGAWMASLYLLLGREAQRRGLGTGHYAAIAYSSAAAVLFPLPWLFGTGYSGYPTPVYLYLLLMALISQLLGHTSINWAVRWVSPTFVAIAILFEPLGSSVLGFIIFGEVPGWLVAAGALVLLVGAAIALWGAAGERDRDRSQP
ncbi:MAG: DMT family transporter [Cyanobacteriota bacterium]|nr:DMT family transporter [Cyanobacteriota bacterium]